MHKILAPRLPMILLAALTDFYTYRLAGRVLGNGYREAAVSMPSYPLGAPLTMPAACHPALSVPHQPLPRARSDENANDFGRNVSDRHRAVLLAFTALGRSFKMERKSNRKGGEWKHIVECPGQEGSPRCADCFASQRRSRPGQSDTIAGVVRGSFRSSTDKYRSLVFPRNGTVHPELESLWSHGQCH